MSDMYGKIKTTAELNKAIHAVTRERKKLGKGVEKDFSGFRNHYRPANLATNFVRQYTPWFTWTELGLGVVRSLKKKLTAPAKPKAVKALDTGSQEPEAAGTGEQAEA